MNGPYLSLKRSRLCRHRGQILMVTTWILLLLTVMAISIGHKVSMALRIASYQKKRAVAAYLAKAAMTVAIQELLRDKSLTYDGEQDSWNNNKTLFEKITVTTADDGFGQVGYTLTQNGESVTRYGLRDTERFINISTAPREVLVALFQKAHLADPEEIADNLLIWRGDIPDDEKRYETLGYPAKKESFSVPEELLLVKGMTTADVHSVLPFITVQNNGKLNINTASRDVLEIFFRGCAREQGLDEGVADSLAAKIAAQRLSQGSFTTQEAIDEFKNLLSTEETNLLLLRQDQLAIASENFFIEVTGIVGTIKAIREVIYNREEKKIVFSHER